MIRQHLQTEENFWPCVSDMFLALFVIALALYSRSSDDKGKGDEFISELAKDEAVALIKCLQESYPNDEELKKLNPGAAKKADKKSLESPELSNLLNEVVKNDSCKKHFPHRIGEPNERIFKNACRYLCIAATGECNHEEGQHQYYHCIKEARERIGKRIASDVKDSSEADQKSEIARRDEEIARLKRELKINNKGRAKDADRIAALEAQVDSLEGEKAILTLKNKRLDDKIEKLTGENKELKEKNTGLQKQIREDFRKQVMQRVRTRLERYPVLFNSVEVLDEEGVVRIPSSTIGFDPSSVVPNPSKTCDAQLLESRLVQLAQFLGEVGQDVKNGHLMVDNISIECHSSPDGEGGNLGKLTLNLNPYKKNETIRLNNDSLSMLRAINIWEKLKKENKTLKEYKNQKDLGLFSTTGCGARVCPKDVEPNARDQASLEKWRRIEIRFNCSPQRVPDTQP